LKSLNEEGSQDSFDQPETVTPKRLHQWLKGGAKTPKEAVMKQGLRELINSPSKSRTQ